MKEAAFAGGAISNDVCAVFFDADGDGDNDLYVGSGCNGDEPGQPSLGDRMYLNDGRGQFCYLKDAVPGSKPFGTAWAKANDINDDSHVDLLIGMRAINGHYGSAAGVYAMMNDGNGHFKPNMQLIPLDFNQYRMTTAADLADFDEVWSRGSRSCV